MKKLLTLVLAAAMLCSVSVTAFAATDLDKNNTAGSMTVSYGVDEGYVVTIPADVWVSTTGVERELSANSVLLPDGKTLTVSVASANGFELNYAGSKIPYTVSVGSTEQTTATFTALSILSGTTSGSVKLTFKTTQADIAGATKAGNHTDTLTFTCGVN